jgi:hypothetical protein
LLFCYLLLGITCPQGVDDHGLFCPSSCFSIKLVVSRGRHSVRDSGRFIPASRVIVPSSCFCDRKRLNTTVREKEESETVS